MNQSKYTDRARAINGAKFVDQNTPKELTAEEFWNTQVRNKEGVKHFYKTYYPSLPEVLVTALADYFDKQISGELPLSEQFYRHSETNKKIKDQVWDYEKEIKEQKTIAELNLTCSRLEKILKDDTEDVQKPKKNKKKKH